jgi:hypothetical protein
MFIWLIIIFWLIAPVLEPPQDPFPEAYFPKLPEHVTKQEVAVVHTDSVRYTLSLTYSDSNEPLYYMAELFTPICYSSDCLPVWINLYWDLLGNYIRYDLEEDEILTKVEHYPFKEEDYTKLHDILGNAHSLLGDYKAEELVAPIESDTPYGVDATTGATLKTIKNEVIDGAVYSCYTLWHITWGEITDRMRKHTFALVDEDMVLRFLLSENHHYQYQALDWMKESGKISDPDYMPHFLQVLEGRNIFFSKKLFASLPIEMFSESAAQSKLWNVFQSVPYSLQNDILMRFMEMELCNGVLILMSDFLPEANDAQKRYLLGILKNYSKLPEEGITNLAGFLEHPAYGKEVYQILSVQQSLDKTLKKEMKKYNY